MNDKIVRILVVDDEQDLCEILRYNLTQEGWSVTTANSAEEALAQDLSKYNLLLLDVMMGGISGFELARTLRASEDTHHVPVIFLTARSGEDDVVKGLELGGDDYITKPFNVREVVARIRAVLRRSEPEQEPADEHVTYQGVVLDLNNKSVTVDGEYVPSTKTEFEILRLLVDNRGHVLSREELIDKVWPDNVMVMGRTVDVNITRVRKKIGPYAKFLITRQGYGYFMQ